MKIKFKRRQRKRIRKFLSGFHRKERTDRYKIVTPGNRFKFQFRKVEPLRGALFGRHVITQGLTVFTPAYYCQHT